MNTKVVTAEENDSAALVLKMMEWKNIHHLPIVNQRSELTGLFTWTDVKHYADNDIRRHCSAADLMRTKLITVSEDTTIGEAKELMDTHKINCLLVVAGKILRGIITTKDL